MASRETPKSTPKVQRTIVKTVASKSKASPASALKKAMSTRKLLEKVSLKGTNTVVETRQRTSTVPVAVPFTTPKPKENKSVPLPSSVTKSAKKASWKRRPKPAHSGVPVPEKMKRLIEKQLRDPDCSF